MIQDVYIHVPFCRQKCHYCVFYSESGVGFQLRREYLNHLKKQLELDRTSNGRMRLSTLYFGGGTPSLLTCEELQELFRIVKENFDFFPDAEISMECNPETLDAPKTEIITSFCNRISLGVQSFDPAIRSILGRSVRQEKLEEALVLLKDVPNLNLDLIGGIPGQTLSMWQQELETALQYNITHLSCYLLTLEENHRLSRETVQAMQEDDFEDFAATIWEITGKVLSKEAVHRYEISNYARNGFECRHNSRIWMGHPYRGFGPAAASFDGIKRWTEVSSLQSWLNGIPPEVDFLPASSRLREVFAMGLRTASGWKKSDYEALATYPVPLTMAWEEIQLLCRNLSKTMPETWWYITPEQIALTESGLEFWDTAASEIIALT